MHQHLVEENLAVERKCNMIFTLFDTQINFIYFMILPFLLFKNSKDPMLWIASQPSANSDE
jgi:hypothetical protein